MTETTHGIPDQIGPYRLLEELGRGGMGIVYHGEHVETGESVAVKTIRVANPKKVESIRREIRALARISHPGVVKILDEDIENGLPWYAMELLKGVTLRQYCSEFVWDGSSFSTAWSDRNMDPVADNHNNGDVPPLSQWTNVSNPLVNAETLDDLPDLTEGTASIKDFKHERVPAASGSLPAVLTLVNRLCQILAYLHGEGIVHGDLKPENILIRPDGMPVLLDFGLVTQFWGEISREELRMSAVAGGTLRYIAPEQLRGELVDARADLYSLGSIFYELVTGRGPFPGEDASDLLYAQLNKKPLPPSQLADGVPNELDTLILHLLKKKPRRRIGYADDVSAVLVRLGAEEPELENLPQSRAYLYRSRFAGRKDEMQVLEDHIAGLNTGKGNFVLIGGESGIGKTRLLLHIAHIANQKKINILSGECLQTGSSRDESVKKTIVPFEALKRPFQSIAEYCATQGKETTDRILGSRGKILALYEPRFANLPGQDQYPAPQTLPVDAALFRLHTYMSKTLAAMTENQPLLLMLDDLQWSDDLFIEFLTFILRTGLLNQTPLLIIGTHRTEEVSEGLSRLLRTPNLNKIDLRKLDQKAVGSIITDMLGIPETASVFTRFLTRFSEGNPFFVSEYLRAAIEEGILYRNKTGIWEISEENNNTITESDLETLPLPKSLLELLDRRLNFLSEPARKMVSAASVIGSEIDLIFLWNLIPFRMETMDSIDELIKRQIVVETNPGILQFAHNKIREIAYERISRKKRAKLHLAAASAIETLHGEDSETYFADLARHWEQAGKTQKAQKYYLAGARRAIARHTIQEAEQGYRAYLNLIEQPDRENLLVHIEFAENVLAYMARKKEAEKEFRITLQKARLLEDPDLESRSLIGLAEVMKFIGKTEEPLRYIQQALEIYEDLGDQDGKAHALTYLGMIRFDQGRLEEAKTLYQQSADIYRNQDDPQAEGIVLANLGPIYCIQGDFEKGLDLFEQSLAIYTKTNNKRKISRSYGNIANLYTYTGEFSKARKMYEEALSISCEIGDRPTEGKLLSNLALTYLQENDLDTALDLYKRALDIQREILERTMEGVTLSNIASIYQDKGLFKEALDLSQQALSINREIEDKQSEAESLMILARLKRRMEADFDQAESFAGKAYTIFKELGDQLGIGRCLKEFGVIALAREKTAQKYIQQFQLLIDKTNSLPTSRLAEEFKKLKSLQSSFDSGDRLFRGDHVENLPEGLKKWLILTNQFKE